MKHIRHILIVLLLVVIPGTLLAQTNPTNQQYDHERFVRYVAGVESCLICHGSYDIVRSDKLGGESLWVDSSRFMKTQHARLGCTACHTNIEGHGHQLAAGTAKRNGTEAELQQGIDETAILEADLQLPEISVLSEKVRDRVKRAPALLACIKCHEEQYKQYSTTVHGQSVIEENQSDPPFCQDCHGWHYILPKDDPESLTNPVNIPATCQRCHAQTEIKRRYGLTKDVATTFEHSFHGRRGEMGTNDIAVCTSCHGTHDIYAADDPRSRVNRERVSTTCGECHQGAQLNFASAFTHGEVSRTELVGVYAVTQAHKWMIVLIIGPLVAIVFLDILRSKRAKKAARNE